MATVAFPISGPDWNHSHLQELWSLNVSAAAGRIESMSDWWRQHIET